MTPGLLLTYNDSTVVATRVTAPVAIRRPNATPAAAPPANAPPAVTYRKTAAKDPKSGASQWLEPPAASKPAVPPEAAAQAVSQSFEITSVQLKQRLDLIPNLVEVVKGYAAHERSTLEDVVKARNTAISAQGPGQMAAAENALTASLGRLIALGEAYPDLKANQNFMALQEEITGTEDKVSYARQFYNDTVLGYNNKLQTFPTVFMARMMNFTAREYFKAEEAAQTPPTVKF